MATEEIEKQEENHAPATGANWVKKNMTTSLNAANLKRLQEFVNTLNPAEEINNVTKLVLYMADLIECVKTISKPDDSEELKTLKWENERLSKESKERINKLISELNDKSIEIANLKVLSYQKEEKTPVHNSGSFVACFRIN